VVARAAHPPNAFPISVNTGFRAKSALFTAFFALFLFSTATAQDTGSIAGVVIDGDFGDSLIGANVVLEGTLLGTSTDLEGRYRIDDIPVGVYTFKYSYIGFQTTYVADVEILNGKTAKIDVTLASESFELQGEVVVEARAIRNNESVLLKDRQKADGVSDAISAEAISRSGSGDAAAAMSKPRKPFIGSLILEPQSILIVHPPTMPANFLSLIGSSELSVADPFSKYRPATTISKP